MRIVFIGQAAFGKDSLETLVQQGENVVGVITIPDLPGRKHPYPVKQLATKLGLPFLQPSKLKDPEAVAWVAELKPDLLVLAFVTDFVPADMIMLATQGGINYHPSLLPKYRGAAPIQWAILNNEPKTGLTVMRMDEGLDTGPILFKREVPILEDETAGQLHDRLSQLAGEVIIEALAHMAQTQVKEVPQDDSLATYASKIERDDSLVDWKETAIRISCLIRALDPKPGAYTLLEGQQIKLFSSTVVDERGLDGVPGRVVRHTNEAIHVDTGQGKIGIREIQSPGKKRLSISDFLRGFPLPEGTMFGK